MQLIVDEPEDLWLELGRYFFDPKTHAKLGEGGNHRFYSLNNLFTVNSWPKGWDNPLISKAVGYIGNGTKMGVIFSTYLNPVAWDEFRAKVHEFGMNRKKGRGSFGMNFNSGVCGKGACLSAMHLIFHDGKVEIYIHAKVVEVPKKFLADLKFISYLITLLDLPQPTVKVTFMISSLYFSLVTLRGYVPLLGLKNMPLAKEIDIEQKIGIQHPTQEKIYRARAAIVKEWGPHTCHTGLPVDFIKGERIICQKDQLEPLISRPLPN